MYLCYHQIPQPCILLQTYNYIRIFITKQNDVSTLPPLTLALRRLQPTVASILSWACGWQRVSSVEMYSVRRSQDTFTWEWRDFLAAWSETQGTQFNSKQQKNLISPELNQILIPLTIDVFRAFFHALNINKCVFFKVNQILCFH